MSRMKSFKHERLYIRYCPDNINGDFFAVNVDGIDYEMSLGHTKQLIRWLDKILAGLKPKQIKFRQHPLALPPCFHRENKWVAVMGYSSDVWLRPKQVKRLYNWLTA